jgi:UPF0042 nucleotide-binding protein
MERLSKAAGRQHLILVSGLSGGGKSTALGALEDLGYYCVDNLPAALLPEFSTQIRSNTSLYARAALGIDARTGGPELGQIPGWLDKLANDGPVCKVLFLTAEPGVLIKRFSETRRRHPLTADRHALPEAIELEQLLLEALQQKADWVLDTSDTNIHQLRRQVWKCVGGEGQPMTVVLESFAFKRGVPQDVDFVFDARNLPNPHWVKALRDLDGLDRAVREWLQQDPSVDRMFSDILNYLVTWLPDFQLSQRSYVTVGIGCTGGRHRSVYLVDRLAAGLQSHSQKVLIHHRELTQ